ncbi:MAG: substrate-binding domain-containing protein [Anaerolineae bacterium]|nr:substrate-binding domain-containing protein [Anaerolineae bacterium]
MMALTLAGCGGSVLPATTPTTDAVILRLNSIDTLPLLTDLTRGYAQLVPHIRFEIRARSYATAAEEAFSDPPVYFLTNHLPPEEVTLWGAPVGQDGLTIITHLGNPVTNLTIEQLRDIYQGRITNWEKVGGPHLSIQVISREAGSGTRAEYERLVMGERRTTQTAQIAPSSQAVLTSVARQTGSIGYISISEVDSRVQTLRINSITPTQLSISENNYPLRTTLFFAGPGEPEGPLRQFIAWVQSPEGQAIVARRYAALINP